MSEETDIIAELRLIEDLTRAKIRVAKPIRDDGVDFLAYTTGKPFRAVPLQLKGGSGEFFSIDEKYERIGDLLIVYMWHVHEKQRMTYALTYERVLNIAQQLGWTQQQYWKDHKRYAATSISDKIRPTLMELLQQYAMTEERWREKLR